MVDRMLPMLLRLRLCILQWPLKDVSVLEAIIIITV